MPEEIEKIPPQSIDAERALLGSLLIDKEAIVKIADIILPQDFYKESHKIIYETMLELWEKREPIDILNLANRLKEKNQLEIIGGRSYLAELSNEVPSATHVISYAKIDRRKAILRDLIKESSSIIKIAYEEKEPLEKVIDKAEQKIFSVSQRFLKQNIVSLQEIITPWFSRIEEIHRGGNKIRGVPTHFTELDNTLAGLQPSDLIILAARPSVGKSALALDIARNVATKSNIPVAIFSLEMSREQILDRLVCAQADINLWKLRTGYLSENDGNDFEKINKALDILSKAPIFIDDSPMATALEIRTKARRLHAEYKLGLIVIDYLQLMESENTHENRVQEVSQISRALKAMARELNIPVLTVSQLSRAVESRVPAIPKLADLRESGSIEQDADVVLFLYRKAMDRGIKNCPKEERNIADVYIAKHRHGPAGVGIKLYFNEQTASFKDLETKLTEEESFEPF